MYRSETAARDWARAIERNREALTAIVTVLFAMLGSVAMARIPRPLHRAVLRVLLPAESAVRRLIVIAARGLVVKPAPVRPKPKGPIIAKGGGTRPPAFPLCDPPERFRAWRRKPIPEARRPRVWLPFDERPPGTLVFRPEDFGKPMPAPAIKDGKVDGARLGRRLMAIRQALADLPRQAKRLARWRAKRQATASPTFSSPLRAGDPPGHRQRPQHEVDHVLAECEWLAHDAMAHDTS